MKTSDLFTRRSVIKAGLAFMACSSLPSFASNSHLAADEMRALHLYNIHTGESIKTIYWEQGVYITDALKDINYVLRDFRTNDMTDMDPRLLDLLNILHKKVGSHRPFEVISGYRTPRTNEMLYEHTKGVNPHSLHMYGKAIDIRLHDCHLKKLRNTAMAMQKGGVGYYPESDFVHIDTGPVKSWVFDL